MRKKIVRLMKRLAKWSMLSVAITTILFAVFINIARAIVPVLNHHRAHFEKWASHVLQRPVHMDRVTVRWYGLDPVLNFSHVVINDPKQTRTLLRIQKLAISIDLFHSVLSRRILPGRLFIAGMHLNVYQNASGQFNIKGMGAFQNVTNNTNLNYVKDIFVWILTQADVSLTDISIRFHPYEEKKFLLNNIRLKISNNLLYHRIAGIASLAQPSPTQFRFIIHLKNTNVAPENFSANAYFDVRNLSLQQWMSHYFLQKYLKNFQLQQGQVNAQTWVQWRHGKLQQVQSLLNSRALVLTGNQIKKVVVDKVYANVLWKHFKDGWGLSADHVQLVTPHQRWPEDNFGLRFINTQSKKILLYSRYVRLEDIPTLGKTIGYWPDDFEQFYAQVKPQGELYHASLIYSLSPNHTMDNHVRGYFKRLTLSAWRKLPGITGWTGFIDATPTQGKIKIFSNAGKNAVHCFIPELFTHPIAWNTLNVAADWQHVDAGWKINVSQFDFNDDTMGVRSRLRVFVPKAASPKIDLLAGFYLNNTKQLAYYLPSRVMSPNLDTWLSEGLPQGSLTEGKLVFHGSLADFPFDNHQGQFEATATLNHVTLHYSSGWPEINEIQGELIAKHRGLFIHADQARILNNPLDHIDASMPDLQKAVLTVSGHSSTQLENATTFLRQTPLSVGERLQGLDFRGPAAVQLQLIIPLYSKEEKSIVTGEAAIENGSFGLEHWKSRMTNIQGKFNFANDSLSAPSLKAEYGGFPLTIHITTLNEKADASILQCMLDGKMSVEAFKKQFNLTALNYFQGMTDYHAELRLQNNRSPQIGTLSVASNLQGISVDLPAPYNKTTEQPLSFLMNMEMSVNQPLKITLHYGEQLSMAMQLTKEQEKFHFTSGDIHLGKGIAAFQTLPGLLIDGALAQYDWTQWEKYLPTHAASTNTTGMIRAIQLQLGELKIWNHTINNIHVDLTPKEQGWSIGMKSDVIEGNLYLPNNHRETWRGYFKRFIFPKMQQSMEKNWALDQLPPLDLMCDYCDYGGQILGKVALRTTPVKNGLIIDKLAVQNPLFTVAATGTWQQENHEQHSTLLGSFTTTNLGAVMSNWAVTQVIEAGRGQANFALSWPGLPYQLKAANLSGDVKVNFHDGRVTEVSKSAEAGLGIGRLLNLFSLQSLPSLPLKIVHLTKKGFVFTLFKGDFNLTHGEAETKDTSLVGPVAWVQINGNIGFVKKNYNLHLKVIPNVTSALPLIVGIVGGPLAGAITWVVNKILAPQLGKVVQFDYRITGNWNEPNILTLPQPADTGTAKSFLLLPQGESSL